ncbi:lytic transglycosylase domain-containing protein [Streptomyces sp. NEAU-W12]|uniref:lytic transglycosylase domain-containing protein n=1 Tax=Streptomyces sp. NEAU-W12 TaxID=2994668 RepID=UPI00224B9871|nr:lytic transglycosylase domain-containing protein [Streptomyces sp. NEAU-W12]MCX2922898.1 lytic transglycosylase domain-containing protein [Streptomyces sp. NEAU-W12]
MSVRRARPRHRRSGGARRRLRTTALAVTAVAALTASQAPGLTPDVRDARVTPSTDDDRASTAGSGPYAEPAPPGEGSYHTELPPLRDPDVASAAPVIIRNLRSQSGIPATVLRAYRAAETSVGRTDPGCRLSWELLAAIGRVESGQARGGAVDRNGTTLGRITGPPLNGRGFALIRDSDRGAHDGDTVYDRAVGPMQFLPSTWARWGVDGNGDGRADPNNIFDAALAAGHYLCAGDRNLARAADLDRAILSYNHSRAYLNLVRHWLEFYSRGVRTVPDGKGVIPKSPGAGGDTPATEPADKENGTGGTAGKDDGIIIGPDPTTPSTPTRPPSPSPTRSPSPAPSTPTDPPTSGTPDPPDESPTDTPTPTPSDPTPSPSDPGPSPTDPDDCTPAPESPSPDPTASPTATPCPTAPATPTTDAVDAEDRTGEPGV